MDAILSAEPVFPPLMTGHRLDGDADPARSALAAVEAGKASAGDCHWSDNRHGFRIAVVLEPGIAASEALAMIPLAMVAAGDSLGALGPPNLAITFGWPDTLFANGGRFGKVSMHFPRGVGASDIADFAVLAISMDLRWGGAGLSQEPGSEPGRTVLHEEGCGEMEAIQLIESWSRHFLAWIDTWEQDGFRPVHDAWYFRADNRDSQAAIEAGERRWDGTVSGLDEHGGLLLRGAGGMQLVSLAEFFLPVAGEGQTALNGGKT